MFNHDEGVHMRRHTVRSGRAEEQLQKRLAQEPIHMRISTYSKAVPDYVEISDEESGSYRYYVKNKDVNKWICFISKEQFDRGAQLPQTGVHTLVPFGELSPEFVQNTSDKRDVFVNVIQINPRCRVAEVELSV